MQIVENQINNQKVQTADKNLVFLKVLDIIGPIASVALVILPFGLHFWCRQPRYLPIGATLGIKNQTIQLEVARKREELAHGLKFRSFIPRERGMLFVIDKPQPVKLWMKDTYVPLDMIFLSDGVIKTIVEVAPPCKSRQCPKYDSQYPVNQIIELPAGSAKTLNLQVGQKIELNFLENKQHKS